jgi:hypothetical protein
MLKEIKTWWNEQETDSLRKLMVHADNARLHPAKLPMEFVGANNMTQDLHPAYSLD